MCGLFASVGLTTDRSRIDLAAHRGPDGHGWYEFNSPAGSIALGHRRLAIIDISEAGQQPMTDFAGRYSIVFNGEIYNYVEVREELQNRGEHFATKSDTEVLLRSFMVWGEACLQRLRGMFAFVIWDDQEKIIFAARDRYGIKPLYYLKTTRGIAFASEIKQLIGINAEAPRANIARVHDFLEFGISDHTHETLFDGICQIRGGEYAVVAAGIAASRTSIRRWYEATDGGFQLSEAEATQQFRCTFGPMSLSAPAFQEASTLRQLFV
jgi:asparagine synthase (glutamine-hydrolysing)